MKEADTLTVDESTYNYIPAGATLTVKRDHTNQFSGKRTLTVEWDGARNDVPNKSSQTMCQLFKMPDDDMWTEIHVGLSREHEQLTFEEEV